MKKREIPSGVIVEHLTIAGKNSLPRKGLTLVEYMSRLLFFYQQLLVYNIKQAKLYGVLQ